MADDKDSFALGFIAGLLVGILVGIPVSWIIAQSVKPKGEVVTLERDAEGRVTAIVEKQLT